GPGRDWSEGAPRARRAEFRSARLYRNVGGRARQKGRSVFPGRPYTGRPPLTAVERRNRINALPSYDWSVPFSALADSLCGAAFSSGPLMSFFPRLFGKEEQPEGEDPKDGTATEQASTAKSPPAAAPFVAPPLPPPPNRAVAPPVPRREP